MLVREFINRHARIFAAIMIVAVAAAAYFTWLQYASHKVLGEKAFFTVDDGKTWFVDSSSHIPPFDHQGKVAVRAYLFYCDSDGKPFVGWLVRYTAPMKQRLERAIAARADAVARGETPAPMFDPTPGLEAKKPGTDEWVHGADAQRLMVATCPDGTQHGLHVYTP